MNLRKIQISLLSVGLLALLGSFALSQPQQDNDSSNSDKPLGEIAKEAKQSKKQSTTHTVITEEDLNKQSGPLPKLNLDPDENNTEEIIKAIKDYKAKHTAEETEQVVHDWYERYDNMLTAALKDNKHTTARQRFNSNMGTWICQDSNYQNCGQRNIHQQRASQEDQEDMMDNNFMIGRIQQSFMAIRNGLNQCGLNYSWFKIRYANGYGTY